MAVGPVYGKVVSVAMTKRRDLLDDKRVKEVVQELQAIDRKVRQHEMAHKVAGGPYAGPPQFKFVRGPDGRLYAVAGEVKIDVSEEKNPEDTIRKMEQVIRAALAPADPSPQDRRVAAEAAQKLMKARMELLKEKEEGEGSQARVDLLA